MVFEPALCLKSAEDKPTGFNKPIFAELIVLLVDFIQKVIVREHNIPQDLKFEFPRECALLDGFMQGFPGSIQRFFNQEVSPDEVVEVEAYFSGELDVATPVAG